MKAVKTKAHVCLNCALTNDYYLDDDSAESLLISNQADLAWREQERASADAILIGANTLQKDNPRLGINDENLQAIRTRKCLPAQPARVVLTRSGKISAKRRFFDKRFGGKSIVICPKKIAKTLSSKLHADAGDENFQKPQLLQLDNLESTAVVQALANIGCGRIFVEGGAQILHSFLHSGTFDTCRFAISPKSLHELNPNANNGVRLFQPDFHFGKYLQFGQIYCPLKSEKQLDGMRVLEYKNNKKDRRIYANALDKFRLAQTLELAKKAVRSNDAYCVGASFYSADGRCLAASYSRGDCEQNPKTRAHAEELLLRELRSGACSEDILRTGVLYVSLEPCGKRKSSKKSCAHLIIAAGVGRVVYGLDEPLRFVSANRGAKIMRDAGVRVELNSALAPEIAKCL